MLWRVFSQSAARKLAYVVVAFAFGALVHWLK